MTRNDSKTARQVLADWYQQFSPALGQYVRRRVHGREDARDLAQEVWRRLCRVGKPSEVLEPLAYLYQAASNVIAEYHHFRSRDKVAVDSEAVEEVTERPTAITFETQADEMIRQNEIERMLASVPKLYRDIMVMKCADGLSYEAIGGRLDMEPSTVKTYFLRGMALIRKRRQALNAASSTPRRSGRSALGRGAEAAKLPRNTEGRDED
jgi:RNA polymerase sigma factor (sigma-70 family)